MYMFVLLLGWKLSSKNIYMYINEQVIMAVCMLLVKMKFLCLLTLIIQGSWIIRVRRLTKGNWEPNMIKII